MRKIVLSVCLAAFTLALTAQTPAAGTAPSKAAVAAPAASTAVIKDLPVRKVVLYKNGVGYFEHAGVVNGSQRVAIDFTSSQLNDVLQSLTALDEGGGRIAGVNYNSTTPLAEQLKTLSLGMTEDPTSTELFGALRGQRVEVTGGPGGVITGRLMSIETRSENIDSTDSTKSIDKFYLTLVATTGAVRVIELTPTLSVRPLDANLQGQLDRYLELLASTHATGLRHLTLDAIGQGQRQLRVSYISEVPVWKSTYRIVFPREATGKATMQGWAVVDNTVGADWDNVQLSLVAGAPQSFIQPLSQPLYARRAEVPIATELETTPQTHEAAQANGQQQVTLNNQLVDSAVLTGRDSAELVKMMPGVTFNNNGQAGAARKSGGFVRNVAGPRSVVSGADAEVPVDNAMVSGLAGNAGGVYRASDAISQGDVSTNAFDDFFEYALTQPVTIHKNESAMVPILQQDLPAEHVTLWSEREPTPLRAVWLENKSSLTLDSGSFSIFEAGEFAGEGLLDPIHPGEKRLLSYASDQAVRVRLTGGVTKRKLHHLAISHGVLVQTYLDVVLHNYSVVNSADVQRDVLIETPRQSNGKGWSLGGDLKAAETTPTLYRFEVHVAPHSTATLEVNEHGPIVTSVSLNSNQNQASYLLELVKQAPNALDNLKPVIDAQNSISDLDHQIEESKKTEETASDDEDRDRDNLTALKGNDAAKRFVDELNRAEDLLQSTRKHTADLEQQKQAAIDKLAALISSLSFDWDVEGK